MRLSTMRRIAVLSLFAVIASIGLAFVAQPAGACSCIAVSDEEALAEAHAVFFGTVIETREDADANVWLVSVEKVVKGEPTATTTIQTPRDSAECGASLPVGQYAVFFAYDSSSGSGGVYRTGLCEPNRVIDTEPVLADLPASPPLPGGDDFLSAFDIGVVEDAPEPEEPASDLPAEEPPTLDDGEVELSEQDQAELAAAGQDEPGTAPIDDGGDSSAATWIVIGLVAMAMVVLGFELRRRTDAR